MEKLNYFNSTYLKEMDPAEFEKAAMPWIEKAITAKNVDKSQLPALLQTRLSRLDEIPAMIDFFEQLPEYSVELYTNKKNKLTAESSLELLERNTRA